MDADTTVLNTTLGSPAPDVPVTPAPTPSSSQLDRSLLHGVAWTAAVQWLSQVLSWAATFFVARALAPDDYGIVAMAMTFTALIDMVSDFGMGVAVVKHRELTADQIGQINGLCVLSGLLGWVLCCLAAYPMSLFFHSAVLIPVVMTLGSGFFVGSFRTVPLSLMQRDLQFRDIAMNQGIQAIALSGVTIVLAVFLGFGYWALVVGNVLSGLIAGLLAIRVRPSSIRWPRIREIGPMLSFGSHMVMLRVFNYLNTTADIFMAGKFLGTTSTGAYNMAMQVAGTPAEKISGLAMRVVPSIISAVQTDLQQLRRYVLGFTEWTSLLTFPAAAGLCLVADDFVHVWLVNSHKPNSEQWLLVIAPLQVLAIACALRSIFPIIPSVGTMIGLAKTYMRISAWCVPLLPAAFFIGSFWGVGGVAAGWLLAYPILTAPYYASLFKRIEMRPSEYLRALWPAVSSTAVMAGAVFIGHHFVYARQPVFVRLVADAAVGFVTYVACLFTLHRQQMQALKGVYAMVRSR